MAIIRPNSQATSVTPQGLSDPGDDGTYAITEASGTRTWQAVGAAAVSNEADDLDATGITDGYVLKADGAGATAWEANTFDGSDVGLADSPGSDGNYYFRRASGVNSFAYLSPIATSASIDDLAVPGGASEGDVLTVQSDMTWAAQAAGGGGGGGGLWSSVVIGGGTITGTGAPGGTLGRSGSTPATFTVTIPAAQLVEGAAFRILAIAEGTGTGDELAIKCDGMVVQASAASDFYYRTEAILAVLSDGSSGVLVMGTSNSTHDTSTDLDVTISGEGFMGEDMTGRSLGVTRVN